MAEATNAIYTSVWCGTAVYTYMGCGTAINTTVWCGTAIYTYVGCGTADAIPPCGVAQQYTLPWGVAQQMLFLRGV